LSYERAIKLFDHYHCELKSAHVPIGLCSSLPFAPEVERYFEAGHFRVIFHNE
jgi:hypothetical protein